MDSGVASGDPGINTTLRPKRGGTTPTRLDAPLELVQHCCHVTGGDPWVTETGFHEHHTTFIVTLTRHQVERCLMRSELDPL